MGFHTNYLMNMASLFFFLCYIPEAYANIRNKNANVYNIPEKVIMLCGTSLALAYAISINDTSLILNYAPLMSLDFTMLVIRVYYAYYYKNIDNTELVEIHDIEYQSPIQNPIHNIESNESLDSHSSDNYL